MRRRILVAALALALVAAPLAAAMRAACGVAGPRTKRSSALPCFVMWPRRYLSADALSAGAKPM